MKPGALTELQRRTILARWGLVAEADELAQSRRDELAAEIRAALADGGSVRVVAALLETNSTAIQRLITTGKGF